MRNVLLRLLPDDELSSLRRRLEVVPIKMRQKLIIANAPIEYVYFPESVSVIADPHHEHPIEVGHIGREGMTEMVSPNGATSTPLQMLVQISGSAWRVAAAEFAAAMSEMKGLLNVVTRYHQAFVVQLAILPCLKSDDAG